MPTATITNLPTPGVNLVLSPTFNNGNTSILGLLNNDLKSNKNRDQMAKTCSALNNLNTTRTKGTLGMGQNLQVKQVEF